MIDDFHLPCFDPIFSFVDAEVLEVLRKAGEIHEIFVRLYFSSKKISPPSQH